MGRKSGRSQRSKPNRSVDLDQPLLTRAARAEYVSWNAVYQQWDTLQELGYMSRMGPPIVARTVEESDADGWAKALDLLDGDDSTSRTDSTSRAGSSSSSGSTSVDQEIEHSPIKNKTLPENPSKRTTPLASRRGTLSEQRRSRSRRQMRMTQLYLNPRSVCVRNTPPKIRSIKDWVSMEMS
jgi:hypothetical protein